MESSSEPAAKVPAIETIRRPYLEYKIKRSDGGKSGLMVIFNMFTKERTGTLKDSARLKSLFEGKFNFDVKVHNNLPKTDVLREIGSIREDIDEESFPQLFFVMLSHGDEVSVIIQSKSHKCNDCIPRPIL
jgi:hypothetical protein